MNLVAVTSSGNCFVLRGVSFHGNCQLLNSTTLANLLYKLSK